MIHYPVIWVVSSMFRYVFRVPSDVDSIGYRLNFDSVLVADVVIVVTVLVVIMLAAMSYYFFERPLARTSLVRKSETGRCDTIAPGGG